MLASIGEVLGNLLVATLERHLQRGNSLLDTVLVSLATEVLRSMILTLRHITTTKKERQTLKQKQCENLYCD